MGDYICYGDSGALPSSNLAAWIRKHCINALLKFNIQAHPAFHWDERNEFSSILCYDKFMMSLITSLMVSTGLLMCQCWFSPTLFGLDSVVLRAIFKDRELGQGQLFDLVTKGTFGNHISKYSCPKILRYFCL